MWRWALIVMCCVGAHVQTAAAAAYVVHLSCDSGSGGGEPAYLGTTDFFDGPASSGTLTVPETCTAGSPCGIGASRCYTAMTGDGGAVSVYVTGGPTTGGADVTEVVAKLSELGEWGVMGFVLFALLVGFRFGWTMVQRGGAG